MQPIHSDVALMLKPMPHDFEPVFVERKNDMHWSAKIAIPGHHPILLELGYSKQVQNEVETRQKLRKEIWNVLELARLGYYDAIAHARADRRHPARRIVQGQVFPST